MQLAPPPQRRKRSSGHNTPVIDQVVTMEEEEDKDYIARLEVYSTELEELIHDLEEKVKAFESASGVSAETMLYAVKQGRIQPSVDK